MGLILKIVGGEAGPQSSREITEGESLRLGRSTKRGWTIPNDPAISREHADLFVEHGQLHVQCLPTATNPVLLNGEPVRTAVLSPGESFRIGNTSFIVADPSAGPSTGKAASIAYQPEEATEYAFSFQALRKVAFRNADRQMEILDQLPDRISAASSDQELGRMLSDLLLEAIPHALAVAVACFDEAQLPIDEAHIDAFPQPLSMQVQTRDTFEERFTPSRRMILKCLRTQNSVLHIFERSGGEFTLNSELGWAFCTPIKAESSQGWCLNVSGRGGGSGLVVTENDLLGDLRFTQLVAQFIGSIRQVRWLQEQRTQLSNFFSPKIVEGITRAHAQDSLQPAEREISVLFCDVRGFSRKAERLQNNLPALLQSVSAALDVMAGGIVGHDGSIADFQGDAALGFWGWPIEQSAGPLPACRSALAIAQAFHESARDETSLLYGFSIGMGIAFGRALAGQIGTSNQSKIGVFGPVVNQGARLEGLTRAMGVSICIDEPTAHVARAELSRNEARLRRLARVRPKGMDVPVTVFALVPAFEVSPQLTDVLIATHDAAVEAVLQGDWTQSTRLLQSLPADDGPTQFLLSQMRACGNAPPADWDGSFLLQSK